jgi:Transglycosylase SLT domain/Domain of unknown function (DUF4124)
MSSKRPQLALLHHGLQGLLLLALVGVHSAHAAAIYKYRDRNGVLTYTNIKPRGITPQVVMVYCPACDPASKVDFSRVGINTKAYASEIKAAISKHPVEEALVRAIMQAESAYRVDALSRSGAQGLMQLMPATADRFGVTDPWNAAQNIHGGVEYLRWLLDFFDGDIKLASAGYNAGENNVLKYAGVPPFAETQVYVKRVAQLYERYRVEIARESGVQPAPTSSTVAQQAPVTRSSAPKQNEAMGTPARSAPAAAVLPASARPQ